MKTLKLAGILKWILFISSLLILASIAILFIRPVFWSPNPFVVIERLDISEEADGSNHVTVSWSIENSSKSQSISLLGYNPETLIGNLSVSPDRKAKKQFMCGTGLHTQEIPANRSGTGFVQCGFDEKLQPGDEMQVSIRIYRTPSTIEGKLTAALLNTQFERWGFKLSEHFAPYLDVRSDPAILSVKDLSLNTTEQPK